MLILLCRQGGPPTLGPTGDTLVKDNRGQGFNVVQRRCEDKLAIGRRTGADRVQNARQVFHDMPARMQKEGHHGNTATARIQSGLAGVRCVAMCRDMLFHLPAQHIQYTIVVPHNRRDVEMCRGVFHAQPIHLGRQVLEDILSRDEEIGLYHDLGHTPGQQVGGGLKDGGRAVVQKTGGHMQCRMLRAQNARHRFHRLRTARTQAAMAD